METSHESFAAFVQASAYCSLESRRSPRPPSADISLPSPAPPPTRLNGAVLLTMTSDEGPAFAQKLHRARLALKAARISEAEGEVTQKITTRKQISRPWREIPPQAPNSGWKRVRGALMALQSEKMSDLVKHRSQITRQVRHRIEAFDKRMARMALSSGRNVATSESAENLSTGDAGKEEAHGSTRKHTEAHTCAMCNNTPCSRHGVMSDACHERN